MSFTCVSAFILDNDGRDNFPTANTLKTVDVKNAVDMYICA